MLCLAHHSTLADARCSSAPAFPPEHGARRASWMCFSVRPTGPRSPAVATTPVVAFLGTTVPFLELQSAAPAFWGRFQSDGCPTPTWLLPAQIAVRGAARAMFRRRRAPSTREPRQALLRPQVPYQHEPDDRHVLKILLTKRRSHSPGRAATGTSEEEGQAPPGNLKKDPGEFSLRALQPHRYVSSEASQRVQSAGCACFQARAAVENAPFATFILLADIHANELNETWSFVTYFRQPHMCWTVETLSVLQGQRQEFGMRHKALGNCDLTTNVVINQAQTAPLRAIEVKVLKFEDIPRVATDAVEPRRVPRSCQHVGISEATRRSNKRTGSSRNMSANTPRASTTEVRRRKTFTHARTPLAPRKRGQPLDHDVCKTPERSPKMAENFRLHHLRRP